MKLSRYKVLKQAVVLKDFSFKKGERNGTQKAD
jgi:hypothetical protein